MALYETLAEIYSAIFPVSEATVEFIGPPPRDGSAIMDLGAGDGAHLAAFAALGWRTRGLEPSEAMLAAASRRPSGLGLARGGMLDLERLRAGEAFACICCLGNTLPHLNGRAELAEFARQAADALESGGRLVIQLLNYGLLGPGSVLEPIQAAGYTFRRSYRPAPDGRLVFATALRDEASGREEEDETLLYPFKPAELEAALASAGLRVTGRYASWSRASFNADSDRMLILEARRD